MLGDERLKHDRGTGIGVLLEKSYNGDHGWKSEMVVKVCWSRQNYTRLLDVIHHWSQCAFSHFCNFQMMQPHWLVRQAYGVYI